MSPRRQDDPRLRQRRLQVAQEAARLLSEGMQGDIGHARRKAAARLGVHDEAALPGIEEIREALREHQRLFRSGGPAPALRRLREAALEAMDFFSTFAPRLVGPVLDGSAQAQSAVCLHLHADDQDSLARLLQEQAIPAEQRPRRVRLDRGRSAEFPAWHFQADGIGFELVLLPVTVLRQAPLEAIGDKPMARASASALRRLLDAEAASGAL